MEVDLGFVHMHKIASLDAIKYLLPSSSIIVSDVSFEFVERTSTQGDTEEPGEAFGDFALRDVQADYLINEEGNQAPAEPVQISKGRVVAEG